MYLRWQAFAHALLLVLFVAAATVFGQATAGLSGIVQDEQEAVVSGAKVTLLDPANGRSREASSDLNGAFNFSQLSPSTYELIIEQTGFAKAQIQGVILNANDQRSLRATLKIAARGETVMVTADAPLVSESPAVATVVNQRFIENQPLNGRSFQSLINLSPGVVLTPANVVTQGQFSVNGQRTGANYFTVDGVSANFGLPFASNPYEGSGGGIPSLSAQGGTAALASIDALQEFTIQTSTYAPEYGRQPGAQVAIVTRSGTNRLHGTASNYLRNDKLDANNWFGNLNGLQRPALRQNDFGFTVGGPALIPRLYNGRDRTFFFVSYEGLRLVQPVISQPLIVPSLAARQRAVSPVRDFLNAYPLPTGPAYADRPDEAPYIAGFSNPSKLNATSVKIDQTVTRALTVFGRYNYSPSENRERARFAAASMIAVLPAKTETLTFGATWLGSPALTNDFRVNWSRSEASQIYEQDTFGGAILLPQSLYLPSFADPATSLLYLQVDPNDDNTISPGPFSRNRQRQFNLINTVSWNLGGHSLKFGFDYRRLAPSVGGRRYSKTLTFNSITELATGIVPNSEVRQVDTFLEPRYHNTSAFVQDTWKATPGLTLTAGVRWEVNPAPGDANGNVPLVVRGLDNPSTATLAPRGERFYKTTYGNFAPRIGVAYQPFSGGGTVLRAGFGMFYDLGYSFVGSALAPGFSPFARIRNYPNRSVSDPVFFSELGPQTSDPPYPRLFSFDSDFALPYTLQYSFAVEQPFGSNSLSLSYVGAAGRRLSRAQSFPSAPLRNPNFTRVDFISNDASSDYNSLQAQFKRRLTGGLQTLLSYTWSKSLDTASDESILNFSAPSTLVDPSSDRGPSSFDVRHSFSGSASYDIPAPYSSGFARVILGGFSLDSIVRLRTATPVLVLTGRDSQALGLTTITRPDLVVGVPLYLDGDGFAGGRRFNPAAFNGDAPMAASRQGTLGRNVLRGFNLQQVDLTARREFRLMEGIALRFAADAFNIFNKANFANPTGVLTSGSFGRSTQILSTSLAGINPQFQVGGPRSVQLSLKLLF